ncbi:MAG: Decarbamoylnovobiocin carbamoyltransferase [Alphaproteobacteria bacterium MarineAlpha5_Bin9]|mgnify:CR=1 FL=1|nr:MAG: Decarbamoylnovobiocin carbamoyltransferase [Alphaproteobacteria bacterium MarineAlpha5_Bin9]|tara:strand:+ start:10402 stop:12231 length:1830 start_codon:yes stop_codon:yes gene_type:complete
MQYILGISSFYHDSAAALLGDGKILAAVQEERFTRIKNDASFPINSILYILRSNNLNLNSIDKIIFYEKPFLKFERILETYLAESPKGFNSFRISMPIWLKEKLFQKKLIIDELKKIDNKFEGNKVFFSQHHLSHASSAFFPSPFNEALVLTLDGVGEWSTTSVYIGKENKLSLLKNIDFPHSLGLLYSAFTYYIGFKVNSDEYKVMGLAPYGKDKYKKIILEKIVNLKDDGSFRLDMSYFNYTSGLTMISSKFVKLFQEPIRSSQEKITQFHMDIASSIQSVINEIIVKITTSLYKDYKINNLCLAGGVALNCVANSEIVKSNLFKKIWIQPASGDAGGALGAALAYWYNELGNQRIIKENDSMQGSYLGPQYSQNQIENSLVKLGANFEVFDEDIILDKTVEEIMKGQAIGWFQGKMEFGPRALGARSILADPRNEKMQRLLNLKIKFRESFRPFAPSVLKEFAEDWFEIKNESPYMLLVADVKKNKRKKLLSSEKNLFGIEKLNINRSEIPAVTHVDYSARVQTINKDSNKKYYNLINKFHNKTGIPVLINTSFNVRNEPIVCTPEDAYNCFMGTDLNILVIGNCFLKKENQDSKLKKDYKKKFIG